MCVKLLCAYTRVPIRVFRVEVGFDLKEWVPSAEFVDSMCIVYNLLLPHVDTLHVAWKYALSAVEIIKLLVGISTTRLHDLTLDFPSELWSNSSFVDEVKELIKEGHTDLIELERVLQA